MTRNITQIFCMVLLVLAQFHVRAQSYQLVWSDEFNYSGLPDASKWSFEDWAPKHVNNELQRYVPNRLENCRAENGSLIIEARRDWYNGSEYSSARIHSANKGYWTYGRMEARMRLPGGYGTWPAFWMMPNDWTKYGINPETNSYWPNCGEIDIMEYVGYDKGKVHGSVHSSKYYFKKGNQRTGTTTVADAETAFHVYAIEWSASKIDFFVDNTKYYTVLNDGTGWESYPFNYDFHIIFNLAVGGDWGGAMGVDPNIWPRRLEIDYVRVYKQAACPVTSLPATIQAENYCSMNGVQLENTSDAGGGQNVGWIDANDWMTYRVNVPTAGSYKVSYRVASQSGGGSIRFEKAGGSPVYGTIGVPATGGWQTWQTISHNVNLSAGEQEVAIAVAAGGFNINWISITPNTTSFSTTIQAESYSAMSGIQTENCSEGGLDVGWIDANDWLAYNSVTIPTAGTYRVLYRVASPNSSKTLRLEKDAGATQLGTVTIPNTGGWQNWATVAHNVTLPAGTYTLGIATATGGFNINYFTITSNLSARLSTEENVITAEENFKSMISPNPVQDKLFINDAENVKYIKIYNIQGQEMISVERPGSSISVQSLKPGVHIAVIEKLDRSFIKGKLVKQ
jgi:beta-glucanase (GH16 family)